MRRDLPWGLVGSTLLVLVAACTGCGDPSDDPIREVRARATAPEPVAGRLLVVRLGDGVEVLLSRVLPRAPRAVRELRRAPRHWRGRWQVRSPDGRVLGEGRFRIPRRRHALFADVGGPARAVDVELERPVVWLRIAVAPGARTVVLYDDFGRRRLGEVTL